MGKDAAVWNLYMGRETWRFIAGIVLLLMGSAVVSVALYTVYWVFFVPSWPGQTFLRSSQAFKQSLGQLDTRIAELRELIERLEQTMRDMLGANISNLPATPAEVHGPGDEIDLYVPTGVTALYGKTALPIPVLGELFPGVGEGYKCTINLQLANLSSGLDAEVVDSACVGLPSTGSIKYRSRFPDVGVGRSGEILVHIRAKIANNDSLIGAVLSGTAKGSGTTTAVTNIGEFETRHYEFSKEFRIAVHPREARELLELQRELQGLEKEASQARVGRLEPAWQRMEKEDWVKAAMVWPLSVLSGLGLIGRAVHLIWGSRERAS